MAFLFGLFGSGKTQNVNSPAIAGLSAQTSVYGKAVAKGFGTNRVAPNFIWYGDFQSHAQTSSGSGGGKGGVGGGGGGKGGGGSTYYTYSTSFMMALGRGTISGVGKVFVEKNVYANLAAAGPFTLLTGGYSQSAWSYLSTAHADQALNYRGTAIVAAANMNLGTSAQLSNYNFETLWSFFVGATPDADASLIVNDVLTNTHDGIGFPSSWVGSLTNYQNYVLAANLLVSPLYDSQQPTAQVLADLTKLTNSEVVWDGTLQIIPYGDTAITGNGKTYAPPSVPLFDLTLDDFILDGQAPIIVTRPDQSKTVNSIVLEYLDRNKSYNPSTVQYKNDASIQDYGLNAESSSRNGHMFCDSACAKASITLQGQREIPKNIYQWQTDNRYIVLNPMDIVTLTNANQNLDHQWVRITEMTELDNGNIAFVAEEYLSGSGHAAQYNFSTGNGYSVNYNTDPGNVNTPIIFEPPVQLAATGLEVWIAASGGANWGGCDVWISSDNTTYQLAERITGESRQGVLAHSLAAGSDPDGSNILQVDLTESNGSLLSGTQADADNFNTLCYVDGELISYETATLTAPNKYNLTYLRRGAYGTTNQGHANASQFARLDNGILKYTYDKSRVGQQVYFKFVSFNIWGGGQQDITSLTPFTHTINGPPPLPIPTGFSGDQNGNAVVFFWDSIDSVALKGYDIGFAAQGETDWNNFEILSEVAKGTEMTNASVPPGNWTFGIRARDVTDQLSAFDSTATFDLVVLNLNPVTIVATQEPGFSGTLHNFIRHWTGVLVPDSTTLANATSDFTIFDNFVVDPVADAYYITPTFDNGSTASLRIYETYILTEGPGQSGSPVATTYIDNWTSGPDPGVYNPWTIGQATFRYVNMKIDYAPVAGQVAYLKNFTFTVDRTPLIETSPISEIIAGGGSTVTFPTPFNIAPFVAPIVQGTSALYATVSSVKTTDCVINVWDHSGVSVGGTVTYTATGV